MTMHERLKAHAEIERRNDRHFDMWKRGVRRKHRAERRIWGAVRVERGVVA